jgi:hypothetical protein
MSFSGTYMAMEAEGNRSDPIAAATTHRINIRSMPCAGRVRQSRTGARTPASRHCDNGE